MTLPACLTIRSQVSTQDAPKYTSEYVLKYILEHALKDVPNCTRWHTPSLLDCTLPSKLSRHFKVHTKYALKYTSKYVLKFIPEHVLKDAPNCTRWYTSSLLDCTLLSKLSRHSQAHSRACSQVHSQEARHSKSHLTICSHVCSCVLDPETC
jgi:hypothetical protein